MCGKMVFGCAISSLSAGCGLLFAFLQHDISKKCVPRFFVSRNFSDVRKCMKRLPVFRNREAYCHECGNNFHEKGIPWKILYMSDCQENNPKVDSLCKLLFLRYLRWSKIQGTYFKISALYFKIYGLCFLR